jgi:alginate O-acetyltransferase complex protein AlgI
MCGMAKKLLLANNIGQLWESYKALQPSHISIAGAWLGILAFAFQIYFDFSGYSDMAVGLGRMFGFEFMENFRYPYISQSITEFWRRWHISLSTWFREYLYVPLGGNRCKKSRWILNLLIVWTATGIWHGASWNYLLWGLYFFVVLTIEKIWIGQGLKKLPVACRHIYTILLILVSWCIFAIEDMEHLKAYLGAMFGTYDISFWTEFETYNLNNYGCVLILCSFVSTPVCKLIYEKMPIKRKQVVSIIMFVAALIICTAYLVAGTYNPFLYFRF